MFSTAGLLSQTQRYPSDIPVSLINHIASFTRFDNEDHKRLPVVPKATHKRIKDAVRRYCDVTAFSLRNQGDWLKAFADDIARTKENLIDIINAMLEILVKESIELPAFSTLDRIAYPSRARANATVTVRPTTHNIRPVFALNCELTLRGRHCHGYCFKQHCSCPGYQATEKDQKNA